MPDREHKSLILVPFDLHGADPAALENLVGIARQLDRALCGVFLSDQRLQQVADLPFTTEIILSSGRERGLLPADLAQRYSRMSGEIRRLLNELAERHRVQLTFEEMAAGRRHTILERNGQLDIFFAPRRRWRGSPFGERRSAIQRLGVVLAGTEEESRVIGAAAILVRSRLARDVYLLSESSVEDKQLQALSWPGVRICVQSNLKFNAEGITALLRQSPFQLLLLPRSCLRGLAPAVLDEALDGSSAQVLVIN